MKKEKKSPGAPGPNQELSKEKGANTCRQWLLRALPLVLALLLLYVGTSFFYYYLKGESWRPFAFLRPAARQRELPTVPSLAPELMFSILESEK